MLTRPLYSFLLYLMAPWVFLRLAWRSRKVPEYRRRWGERFGMSNLPRLDGAIWVHAVSVGEVQAAVPLVRSLLKDYPQRTLVLTTTTPTGSARVQSLFGDEVEHVYVPYDLPGAVRRFLDRVRPCTAIIMETELWPNLFAQCGTRGVPIIVANARLSQRSMDGYKKAERLARATLGKVAVVAAQGEQDAERFRALAPSSTDIRVTGSIKFDVKLPASLREEAEVLRMQLGVVRPVWIAASTHEGEDDYVLDAHAQVLKSLDDALLVLVPRHPERASRILSLCRKYGMKTALRSQGESCDADTRVYIGDTLGELALFYAASDVAFVGGSLVPVGGHNVLEPAAQGLVVVTGPHTFNFEEITTMLIGTGGATRVEGALQLANAVEGFLRDANMRHSAGEKGKRLVEENRGAVDRLLGIVGEQMNRSG